ncbi:MAG: hypothetical protein K2Q21_05205 [Chitinophagaceae bacterium]|nr:hypothetical protein [Chitinophagaceae bacterium]
MKKHSKIFLSAILLQLLVNAVFAQAEKNSLSLSVGYFNSNNQTQYLIARAKSKIDGKFQMIPGISVSFYISTETPENLLGKAVTNDKGEALIFMPPKAKDEWMKSAKVGFLVSSASTKLFDEAKGSFDLTKAKILIDTAADKKITATVMELKDSVWTPVKAVDVKIAIKRLDADLNVADAPTYATDSLGIASADFKRDSLPGDAKGNLTLIAKVEDNDLYGNLSAEKVVPWGKSFKYYSEFDKRTLFARRGKSPMWLELLAYSIVVAVWGVLIYLVGQIKKLKKLGVN